MLTQLSYRTICALSLLILVVGCRPQQTDPLPDDPAGPEDTPVAGTASGESLPAGTEMPLRTSTPLPSPPDGWVELLAIDLGVVLYHPVGWEVIPFDDHKLDLRAPEGDGWIEINRVDASNAQDWGAGDQSWDGQAILTTLVTAAREDGEFNDPGSTVTIIGTQAWTTQGINDVIGDRLWIGVTGLGDGVTVALGHGQETTENWDSELVATYQSILSSIHLAP